MQAILGCGPVGPCRGVTANCGDLPAAFADTPVLPDFPDGMADYVCAAFPNDENERDSLIVGLLAFAIALPVTLFLQTCFELANDNEAPESWLMWAGLPRLALGAAAARRWHYTGPQGQPSRFVRWYCRSVDAPKFETLLNLWLSFKAWATCSKPPWMEEAEEAEAEDAAAADSAGKADASADIDTPAAAAASDDGSVKAHSVAASFASAKELRFSKRRLTAVGIGGIYLIWAFFSWVVFTYGSACPHAPARVIRCRMHLHHHAIADSSMSRFSARSAHLQAARSVRAGQLRHQLWHQLRCVVLPALAQPSA